MTKQTKQTEQSAALEKELQTIWLTAANTRKGTAPRRIETILEHSRAELALRDLLIFFSYLGLAFFMLAGAVIQALFNTPPTPINAPPPANSSRNTQR